MNIEYKKSYGLCDKHEQKITIKIKFFIDETLDGIDIVKDKIEHCPLDLHHQCRREQCSIWLKADSNYRK